MRTILFLDIDGVLSIPNTANIEERKTRWPGCGVFWPIPIAFSLIRAIDACKDIYPVWLSAWDVAATNWNEHTHTCKWPVAYHLTRRQATYAKVLFPEYETLDLAHSHCQQPHG